MNRCECTDYQMCKYCLMSEEEYYIPEPIDIDPITTSEIEYYENLRYVQNKLFAALGIPAHLLNAEAVRKCECGGEKANTTHSDWCPKWQR